MLDLFAIFCAKYLIALALIFAAAFALKLSKQELRSMIILAAIALPLIYLTAVIASHLCNNPRPFVVEHFVPLIPHDADNGFPSDHVLLVSAIAAIWTVYRRRIGVVLWAAAVAIGIARVYVGVHHPIDVIGSAVIAGVITFGLYTLLRRSKFLYLFNK